MYHSPSNHESDFGRLVIMLVVFVIVLALLVTTVGDAFSTAHAVTDGAAQHLCSALCK